MELAVSPNLVAAAPRREWPNRFRALGESFYTSVQASPLPNPHWVATSPDCAEWLGLPPDWDRHEDLDALAVFSGERLWSGMAPLASVYSGHQFGSWAGQLGDGRALWLGELQTPAGPLEVQLKGAGPTPYSRRGDGRAVLRSSIREFLCSEAMDALGVPTTRALCVVGSPLPVRRETVETAAVVTRVAASFVRFGHFEHFAALGLEPQLRALADFTIAHHFPECGSAANPYLALLEQVARRTAALMAAWQAVGFCHGVMNTDNMSILGLTIDYGPFGFLDAFDPGHVCNHSDHEGRYAWSRQPQVAYWNLHALAHALLPLIGDTDGALAALATYEEAYADALLARWRAKLGLVEREADDRVLVDDLLRLMAADRCDFSITFRLLSGLRCTAGGSPERPARDLFIDRAAFDAWADRYRSRLVREGSRDAERAARMNLVNPKFVLRNHLAEEVIRAAQAGDFAPTRRLLAVLRQPHAEQDAATSAAYAGLPPDWAASIEVSCSS
ncbi:MAG: YdiU family protein [Pseudomonadota bacterium]|nr:YdiU family protein [Pseudomonadota bacterium]